MSLVAIPAFVRVVARADTQAAQLGWLKLGYVNNPVRRHLLARRELVWNLCA